MTRAAETARRITEDLTVLIAMAQAEKMELLVYLLEMARMEAGDESTRLTGWPEGPLAAVTARPKTS